MYTISLYISSSDPPKSCIPHPISITNQQSSLASFSTMSITKKESSLASLSTMSSISSTHNQPPNKGKGKVVEESEAILKMVDHGKEIFGYCDNKRKVIEVAEPNVREFSKIPKTGAEVGGENSADPTKVEEKVYPCTFCDKTFASAQALGGHQNGHKKEKQVRVMQQRKEAMRFMSTHHVRSPILPPHKVFIGKQEVRQNPMIMTPYARTGGGYQHDGLSRSFQYGGTPSSHAGAMYGAMETANSSAFPHPQRVSAGFDTGSGTLEIPNGSAFQRPDQQAWFNPGSGTPQNGNNGAFLHPLSAGFSAGIGSSSGALGSGHGAFQHPGLARFPPVGGTNNNGGVDNVPDLSCQIKEVKESEKSYKSRFIVFLPDKNDQIPRSEVIDFGVLPERNETEVINSQARETQKDEASEIDLTLKL